MNITDIIPFGRENAITRKDLCRLVGTKDRAVRNAIEEARREGAIIINAQDGKGYYQTDDLEEIRQQYHRNNNRAMSILVQQKHLRRRLKKSKNHLRRNVKCI